MPLDCEPTPWFTRNGKKALTKGCTVVCALGGTIEVSDPGPGAFDAD